MDCFGNNIDSDLCWVGICYFLVFGNLDKVEMIFKVKVFYFVFRLLSDKLFSNLKIK